MTAATRVPVLIAGAGPVGLVSALLLDRLGVDSVVVEKNPSVHEHPRARLLNARTMEILRGLGLDEVVRANAPGLSEAWTSVDSVAGREIARTRPEPNANQGPAWKCFIGQDVVERVLADAVEACSHARIAFSTELISYREADGELTVTTRSVTTAVEQSWSVQYLIGADGAGSRVRELAGIEFDGTPALASVLNEYWSADLSHLDVPANVGGFFILSTDPELPPITSVLRDSQDGHWMSMFTTLIGGGRSERPWDDARAADLIRRQIGDPSVTVELHGHDTWRLSSQVARNYRAGRVFVVGDAAHVMPPTGGFGLNTGVQDAHNLAWKLALVLAGQAADRLLDTYETERRPIAQSNTAWSSGNAPRFITPATKASSMPALAEAAHSGNADRLSFWVREMENHTHSAGRALGFWYEDGAIIPDGTAPPVPDSRFYTPGDRPGGRFPHLWLDPTDHQSTLDWFSDAFVLVAGPLGGEWLDAGEKVAESLDVPLQLRTLADVDTAHGFRLGARGAVLVRPDGHVAWRMAWLSPDPVQDLTDVLTTLVK